jgi:hypothetical protein
MSGRRARANRRLRPSQVKSYAFPAGAKFNDSKRPCRPCRAAARALHRHPDIRDPLIAETTFVQHYGRRAIAAAGGSSCWRSRPSGIVEYKTFRDRWASSPVWQLAGFERTPSQGSVWLRLDRA